MKKNIIITGASNGIGFETALELAKDENNTIIAIGRSLENLKRLHTIAKQLNPAAQILPVQFDIFSGDYAQGLIPFLTQKVGKIDILINNASAINLTPTEATPAKRFDLMFDVNVRGTFLTSQAAMPHLRASAEAGRNPHILTLSPPLSMKAKWFQHHVAYTMAKYGMSMCVLGMSEEYRKTGIAVNALWPRTAIDTAALQMIPGIDTATCRTPEILADAAYVILNRVSKDCTGNFFVDDEVLASVGVTDLEKYSVVPGTTDFLLDFFLD